MAFNKNPYIHTWPPSIFNLASLPDNKLDLQRRFLPEFEYFARSRAERIEETVDEWDAKPQSIPTATSNATTIIHFNMYTIPNRIKSTGAAAAAAAAPRSPPPADGQARVPPHPIPVVAIDRLRTFSTWKNTFLKRKRKQTLFINNRLVEKLKRQSRAVRSYHRSTYQKNQTFYYSAIISSSNNCTTNKLELRN